MAGLFCECMAGKGWGSRALTGNSEGMASMSFG
jgi:hypothetical protein